MALRQDLVMRMIEQLGQAFEQVVAQDDDDTSEDLEDVEDVEAAIAGALHTKRAHVTLLGPGALEERDDEVAGRLGLLYALLARDHADAGARQRALAMAAAGLPRADLDALPEQATPLLTRLVERAAGPDDQLAALHALLFELRRRAEDLTGAEDHLFAALERGAPETLRARGRQWYAELLEREDPWLEAHDLPRTEILDALEDLEQV